jgi:purine-nucleoside phosphorylase
MLGFEQIQAAKAAIFDRFEMDKHAAPRIGIVLGSGLGGFADHIKQLAKIKSLSYGAIAHFPTSSIEGHSGHLHYGLVGDTPVVAMQGRVHAYEGYTANEVVFPVRVMAALGVKTLILTNAAGAINASFAVGDLMLITDHINMTGDNPQIGPNDARLGQRFFDMTQPYSKRGLELAALAAANQKIQLREGCYVSVLGPSYETPAEIRMMRGWGADAVGMSTVFETIAARHMGVEVVGFSCLTNMASGVTGAMLDHSEVQSSAQIASDRFTRLLSTLIPTL